MVTFHPDILNSTAMVKVGGLNNESKPWTCSFSNQFLILTGKKQTLSCLIIFIKLLSHRENLTHRAPKGNSHHEDRFKISFNKRQETADGMKSLSRQRLLH